MIVAIRDYVLFCNCGAADGSGPLRWTPPLPKAIVNLGGDVRVGWEGLGNVIGDLDSSQVEVGYQSTWCGKAPQGRQLHL